MNYKWCIIEQVLKHPFRMIEHFKWKFKQDIKIWVSLGGEKPKGNLLNSCPFNPNQHEFNASEKVAQWEF